MRLEPFAYERIRQLRIDHDLTQKEIAAHIQITKRAYSHYEIGTRQYPIEVLIKLAIFYNTSVDYLLCLTDEPNPHHRLKKTPYL